VVLHYNTIIPMDKRFTEIQPDLIVERASVTVDIAKLE
jgi:hypothetical protein